MTARKRKLMTTLHLPMDLEDFATLVADLPHTYEGGEARIKGAELEVWAHGTRPRNGPTNGHRVNMVAITRDDVLRFIEAARGITSALAHEILDTPDIDGDDLHLSPSDNAAATHPVPITQPRDLSLGQD